MRAFKRDQDHKKEEQDEDRSIAADNCGLRISFEG